MITNTLEVANYDVSFKKVKKIQLQFKKITQLFIDDKIDADEFDRRRCQITLNTRANNSVRARLNEQSRRAKSKHLSNRNNRRKVFDEPSEYYIDLKYNQCYTESNPFDIFSLYEILPAFDSFERLISTKCKKYLKEICKVLVSLLNFVYQLFRSRNLLDILSAITSFTMVLPDTMIIYFTTMIKDSWDHFACCFCASNEMNDIEMKEICVDGVYCEAWNFSMSDKAQWLKELLTRVLNTEVYSVLRQATLGILSMHWFGKDFAKSCYSFLGFPEKNKSFLECLNDIMSGIVLLLRCGEALLFGTPISEVLLSEDPCTALLDKARTTMFYHDKVFSGNVVLGQRDIKQYYCELQEISETATHLLKSLPTISPRYKSVKEVKMLADEKTSLTLNKMASSKREPPIAIVLGKEPGIGKSRLAEVYYRLQCKTTDREFREGMVFTRCTSSEYFDGCNPMSQQIYVYGEAGNMHADLVSKLGDPIISEIQSLIDGTPFPMNMAFKEKGMYNAVPEFLLIHTNNMLLNFDKLMYDPRAMLRRLLFVEAEVLPQFTDKGGIMLDVEKSVKAGGNLLDRYVFTTYIYTITKNGGVKTLVPEGCGDIYKHTAFIEEYMRKHYNLQSEVLQKVNEGFDFLYADNINSADNVSKFRDTLPVEDDNSVTPIFIGEIEIGSSIYNEEEEKGYYSSSSIFTEAKPVVDGLLRTVLESDANLDEFEDEPVFVMKRIENKFVIHDTSAHEVSVAGIDEVTDTFHRIPHLNFNSVDEIYVYYHDDGYFRLDINHNFHMRSIYRLPIVEVLSLMERPWRSREFYFGLESSDVSQVEEAARQFVEERVFEERTKPNTIDLIDKFIYYCSESIHGFYAYVYATFLTLSFLFAWSVSLIFWGTGSMLQYVALFFERVWPGNYINLFVLNQAYELFFFFSRVVFYESTERILNSLKLGIKVCKKFNETFRMMWKGNVNYLKQNPKWTLLASGVVVVATMLSCFLGYKVVVSLAPRRRKTPVVVESLRDDVKVVQQRQFNATEGIKRFAPRHGTTWTQTIDNEFLAPHKGTLKDLSDKSGVHTHYVIVKTEVGERITRVAGIDGTIYLINEHAFAGCSSAIIRVPVQGVIGNNATYEDILIESNDFVRLGNDLLLIDLHSMKRQCSNMLKHFISVAKFQSSKGRFLNQDVNLLYNEGSFELLNNEDSSVETVVTGYYSYYADHEVGDCGSLVVAQVDSKSVGIVAVHSGGSRTDRFCIASAICRDVIEKGMELLRNQRKSRIFVNSATRIPMNLRYLPHHKSVWAWQQFDHVTYIGTVEDDFPTLNKRSELRHMPYANRLPFLFQEHFNWKRTADDVYGRPTMMPYTRDDGKWMSPYTNIMESMNKPVVSLSGDVLDTVVEDLVGHISTEFRARGICELNPLVQDCAINGVVGDYYTKRINTATSAGFGYSGGKRKHLPFVDDDEINREPTDVLQEAIDDLISCYLRGESGNCPIVCQLKDEPRSLAKVRKAKTRGFYMVNLPFLVVARMFLSPFYTLMVQYSDLFYTAVGINMHVDSDDLIVKMRAFAESMMEGDYGAFDVTNPIDIARAASTVVYRILEEFGYNEESLLVVKGLLSDGCYPLIYMLGDLFIKAGHQPSGKYATAEDNSLRALVMLMYFWYSNPELCKLKFREFCRPITYGDDTGVAVKDGPNGIVCELYNNQTYQTFCKEVFGMEYTAADKSLEISKFVPYEEFTFLKRKFVMNSDGVYEGRLSLASIYKTLEWLLPSRSVTPQEQVGSMLASTAREVFFHLDEKTYPLFVDDLLDIVSEGMDFDRDFFARKIPSYRRIYTDLYGENLDSDYCESEGFPVHHQAAALERTNLIVCNSVYVESHSINIYSRGKTLVFTWPVAAVFNKATSLHRYSASVDTMSLYKRSRLQDLYAVTHGLIHEYESKLEALYDVLTEYKESVSLYQLQHCHENYSDTKYCMDMADYKKVLADIEDCKATLFFLKTRVQRQFPRSTYVESEAIVNDMNTGDMNLKTLENLQDVNGADIDEKDSGTSTYPNHGIREVLDISAFFRRPIEIASFNISIGTQIDNSYAVWNLYSLIPSVRAKLKNYAFFRGDLHLRVIITGSPFHYGRILASYQPYAPYNINLVNYATIRSSGIAASAFDNYINYLSQAPGAVSMDVKNNRPHEITCPFISPKNCHRLYNASSSAISAVTSFADFTNAGSLYLVGIQPLQTVSTVSSSVCVQIYAWVENIELGCVTATQTAITTESRPYWSDNDIDLQFGLEDITSDDEYPYDSVEEFNSPLTWCYVESGEADERKMGPVERMSSSLAHYSSMFSVIPPIAPLAMACTTLFKGLSGVASWFGWSRPTMDTEPIFVKNQPFMNGALTIGTETAQKLTLDPKQGLTVDPRIVGIEHDELAINNLAKIESYLTQFSWDPLVSLMQDPIWTCAVTPQLSSFYSGSTLTAVQPTAMSYVTAPFDWWHGTIKFRFEVVRSEFHRGKIAFIFEPNIQQGVLISSIFSLNKNFIYILDIQESESVELYIDWAQPRSWQQVLPAVDLTEFYSTSNSITFTNSLSTNGVLFVVPFTNLTSPISSDIQVNVYVSCEDLRVNQLDTVNMPVSRVVVTNSSDVHSHSFDIDVKSFHLVKSNFDDTGMCQHYFGESPLSLRALLKRYVTTGVKGVGTQSGSTQSVVCTMNNLPISNPKYGATFSPTFYDMSLWYYLPYAFLGVRGSVRRRIHTVVNSSSNMQGPQQRSTMSIGPVGNSLTETAVWATDYSDLRQIGSVPFVPHTNGGIEVEIPFYSPNLFAFSFTNDLGLSEAQTDEMIVNWSTQCVYTSEFQGALGESANVNIDSAIGDDFTYLRYTGAPFYSFTTG